MLGCWVSLPKILSSFFKFQWSSWDFDNVHTPTTHRKITQQDQFFRFSFEKLSWTSLVFLGLHFLPFLFQKRLKFQPKKGLRREKSFGEGWEKVALVKVLEGWVEPRWSPVAWRHTAARGQDTRAAAWELADRNSTAAKPEHTGRHFSNSQKSKNNPEENKIIPEEIQDF